MAQSVEGAVYVERWRACAIDKIVGGFTKVRYARLRAKSVAIIIRNDWGFA